MLTPAPKIGSERAESEGKTKAGEAEGAVEAGK